MAHMCEQYEQPVVKPSPAHLPERQIFYDNDNLVVSNFPTDDDETMKQIYYLVKMATTKANVKKIKTNKHTFKDNHNNNMHKPLIIIAMCQQWNHDHYCKIHTKMNLQHHFHLAAENNNIHLFHVPFH